MLGKEELRNQSIAVIGAGIIGLSIGLKLQQQGIASPFLIRMEWAMGARKVMPGTSRPSKFFLLPRRP